MGHMARHPMAETHRTVLAPLLLDMLPAGDFGNFMAAGHFSGLQWCKDRLREMRKEVMAGIQNIRSFGLMLPSFARPAWPSALAFDPLLLRDPLRRHQDLWHIHGPTSCVCCSCCISYCHDLNPVRVLLLENRNHRSLMLLKQSIDFLDRKCSYVELACWECVPTVALPWPLMQRFPKLPHKDFYVVDYAVLCFRYKTVGFAMCFWCHSPHPWPQILAPPSSTTSSSEEDDDA